MEERKERKKQKTITPKIHIDEQMQQEWSTNDEKTRKSESRCRKNQGNGDPGCLQEATKHEVEKTGAPLTTRYLFYRLWTKIGAKMEAKKNVTKNIIWILN